MKSFLLFICLLSSSCVKNVEQFSMRSYFFSGSVDNECQKIQSTGDIYELLAAIKTDTKAVLKLLDGKSSKDLEVKIGNLANNIDVNATKVMQLSKVEWNDPYLRYSIIWKLDDSHFGSRNLYVYNPTVKNVYFLGKEHPELVSRVKITQRGNDIVIEYINLATMLEYCQLNETLMIVLEMNYGNDRNPKSLFFNLNVNLEK